MWLGELARESAMFWIGLRGELLTNQGHHQSCRQDSRPLPRDQRGRLEVLENEAHPHMTLRD